MTTRSPTSVDRLDVMRNEDKVGSLFRTTDGCVFRFDDAFFKAHHALPGGLTRHLPFAQKEVVSVGDNLPPYFAGLLPEGRRLKAISARAKTSEDDLFSLLVAAGPNCVGDLFPVLPGSRRSPLDEDDETRPLDQLDFNELFAKSLDGASPSIAGVQEKLSASMISFPFATAGKRFILKLNPPDRERLVENEHFFMQLAAACGLQTAKTHLVHDRSGAAGLLVERFDRVRVQRRWRGVRQEDACQLLNRYPAAKYTIKTSDVATALESCASPVAARARLIELLAFSYLVGNGDLHGKNVSVTMRGDLIDLSDAYDLLCTRPYKDRTLALEFEGRRNNVKRRDFIAFGERFGVAAKATEARLDRLLAAASTAGKRFAELGFDPKLTRQMTDQFDRRRSELTR